MHWCNRRHSVTKSRTMLIKQKARDTSCFDVQSHDDRFLKAHFDRIQESHVSRICLSFRFRDVSSHNTQRSWHMRSHACAQCTQTCARFLVCWANPGVALPRRVSSVAQSSDCGIIMFCLAERDPATDQTVWRNATVFVLELQNLASTQNKLLMEPTGDFLQKM